MVTMKVTSDELELLQQATSALFALPNQVTDIYKMRRGRWTGVKIWSLVDLGTCRKKDLFLTDANYNKIEDFKIVNVNFTNELGKYDELLNKFNNKENKTEETEEKNKFKEIEELQNKIEESHDIENELQNKIEKEIDWDDLF